MPAITYDLLRPLIANEHASGASVSVTFRCPLSGTEVRSSSYMQPGVSSRAKQVVASSVSYSIRSGIASAVRSMVGGGVVGHAVSGAVYAAMPSGSGYRPHSFSDNDRRQAVVDAFQKVQGQFVWDEQHGTFVSAAARREEQPAFSRQVEKGGPSSGWDQAILARVLAEVIGGDGRVGDDERQWFAAFAGSESSLDSLLQRPPVTAAELQETSPGARENLLMLAWAVAYSDTDLDPREVERIHEVSRGLRIPSARSAELAAMAREYVVDQALEAVYANGWPPREHLQWVADLASRVGMDPGTLAQLDARCRKRRGVY